MRTETFALVIGMSPSAEFILSEVEGLRVDAATKQSDTNCHSERT
ncbi:MAG: hypothetical protein ACREOB_12750 [Thermodesulfobacteriota bacterium]